jgi:hypothetical protein
VVLDSLKTSLSDKTQINTLEGEMETRPWTLALLALVGSSTLALADISGGPVFGGGAYQKYIRCMVFNAGPGTATITSHRIANSNNVALTLNFDSCGATLPANRSCVIGAPAGGFAYQCKFVTSGGVLRGTVSLYDFSDYLLHSSDMR